MRILEPNIDKKVVPILKHHLYVLISDFRQRKFLKEVFLGPGQHSWEWIVLDAEKSLDISGINNKYCTFNHAINKAINDLYCTVYEFENFEEMAKNWTNIEYIDGISTIYDGEGEV